MNELLQACNLIEITQKVFSVTNTILLSPLLLIVLSFLLEYQH